MNNLEKLLKAFFVIMGMAGLVAVFASILCMFSDLYQGLVVLRWAFVLFATGGAPLAIFAAFFKK